MAKMTLPKLRELGVSPFLARLNPPEPLREARQMDALREAGATHYIIRPDGLTGYRQRPDGSWEYRHAQHGRWLPRITTEAFMARLIPLETERAAETEQAAELQKLRKLGATHYLPWLYGLAGCRQRTLYGLAGYRQREDGAWEFCYSLQDIARRDKWKRIHPTEAFLAEIIPLETEVPWEPTLETEQAHTEVRESNPDHWALLMEPNPHNRYEPWR
jgi:hypothetical protein